MTGSRSLVAGVNALFRAVESKRPSSERLLYDPWAERLAERDPRVAAIRYGRFALPSLRAMVDELQTAHCVRHRSIDELVLAAIRERNYRRIVITGAGYDMRASRFESMLGAALAGELSWIELDHPATLARKNALLREVGGLNRRVERIAIDLLTDSLANALDRTSIDRAQPACFVIEGVLHYLTPPAVDALFGAIRAASAHPCVVLSFIRSDEYDRAPSLFIRLVKILDEIPRLHFTRESLAALASRHGFAMHGAWTIEQQVASFAPEGRGRSWGLSQDVALLEGQVL